VSFETVRKMALSLPGVEEGVSYGTPAFRVGGAFLARLKEDGDSLALRMGFEDRERLMASRPEAFYLTDHYRDYPAVLVRLSSVSVQGLREALELGWRKAAPAKLQKGKGSRRGRRTP
jgi:hypothetical protein